MTAKGTVDYPTVLRRMPAATRERIYKELLSGRDGQPGIEEQFVSALIEWRTYTESVETREAFTPQSNTSRAQWEEDVSMMKYLLYTRKERLDLLANELARLQEALDEIAGAGTNLR